MKSCKSLFPVLSFVYLLSAFFLVATNRKAFASKSFLLDSEISAVLSDYSQSLTFGRTIKAEYYSPEIESLIVERRQYYKEFYEKGLHANLISLDSHFVLDENTKISQAGDVFKISIFEKITMEGDPITSMSNDYPLIQAARWAIEQTDDMEVEYLLNDYIEVMTRGVDESVRDGVKIVFLTKHSMDIRKETDQIVIVKDTFSDKDKYSDGFDNVVWTDKGFVRQKPNWTQMIDYKIYRVPVETTGHNLLKTFEAIAQANTMTITSTGPLRTRAIAYIMRWTSTPPETSTCSPGVRQDKSKYNPDYDYISDHTGCDDCTNYVSQALYYAGFPTDSVWYDSYNSRPWVAVNPFFDYFAQEPRGTDTYMIEATTIGDVAVQLNTHLAMITGVNPHRYSAHTSDCYQCAWNTNFNWFIKPNYYQYQYNVYLPISMSDTFSAAAYNLYNSDPYPSPMESWDNLAPQPYPTP